MTRNVTAVRSGLSSSSLPRSLSAGAALLVLQGCGGGGGGDGPSADDPLGACRAEAELIGLDFEFYQSIGGCLPEQSEDDDPFAVFEPGDEPATIAPPEESLESNETPVTNETPPPTLPPVGEGPTLPDVEGSSVLVTANNSARLTGARFGSGTVDNASLFRTISTQLQSESPDVVVSATYIGAGGSGPVVGILTSRANATLCGVRLVDVGIVDRTGRFAADSDDFLSDDRVNGVVALNASGRTVSDCLAPGESSYFVSFTDVDAPDVAAYAATTIVTNDFPSDTVATAVLPIGYEVEPDGDLTVTVQNQGLVAVETFFSQLIVLDESGLPIDYTNDITEQTLAPGERTTRTYTTRFFDGSSDTIRVIFDFDLPRP